MQALSVARTKNFHGAPIMRDEVHSKAMTPQDVADLLKAQRVAKHLEIMKGIRGTIERRIYVQSLPGDVVEDVKATYLAWHKTRDKT
jgi:hypothetical protein